MQNSHHRNERSASDKELTPDDEPNLSPSDGREDFADTNPPWSSEPFRAFFPLGIAAAILGVLIWPLFYAGWWNAPPPLQHPRLMIFGFGTAFITGFLGTAWPRFLEAPPMRNWELGILTLLWFAAQLAWILNRYALGDLLIAGQLSALLLLLIHRAKIGRDQPPAGLWIALLGPVLGITAALVWGFTENHVGGLWYTLCRLFAWQGMLLLPLMGVGIVFFPRFFPQAKTQPSSSSATFCWLAALLLMVSFLTEAYGWVRIGNGLRFASLLIWALRVCPSIIRGAAKSTRAWALRLGLGSIAASVLIRSCWPGPGFAMEHLLFIGGFGLVMTLVAERVTLGHADCPPAPTAISIRWRWLAWILLLTASTRMTADLKASLLISHHVYAALMWSGVLLAWVLPLLKHWRNQPTP